LRFTEEQAQLMREAIAASTEARLRGCCRICEGQCRLQKPKAQRDYLNTGLLALSDIPAALITHWGVRYDRRL
jgi:hypothetical protein